MKEITKARLGGTIAFGVMYAALRFLQPIVPEGTWTALIALFMAAWAADQIEK